MTRKKMPWCIEIEFEPTREGGERSSEFYVVKRVVGDVKDLHLLVVEEGKPDEKVSIDRRDIAKIMMVNSTKEEIGATP